MEGRLREAPRLDLTELGARHGRISRGRLLLDVTVAIVLLATGARVLVWRFDQLDRIGPAGWALFSIETVAVVWAVVTAVLVIGRVSSKERAPEADEGTTLDILIPVAGESVKMVGATITAAQDVYWHHRVIVCNDGYMAGKANWKEIERLCTTLGVECITRTSGALGKAGNLNNALHQCSGDVVLTVDADHRVVPGIAKQMLGYFRHDEVAFVATPQHFHGAAEDPLNPTEPVFYKAIQPAADRHGVAFSTGNCAMYRREALVRIGGFSEWSVVEDLHTSIRLHDAGWSSVFYPRPMSIGVAPATAAEYARQRLRWAVDSLRILRFDPPWRRQGLSRRAKLHYTHTLLSYPAAMIQLGFLLAPAAWIVARMSVMADGEWQRQLQYLGPWLAAVGLAVVSWAGPRGALRSIRLTMALLPCVFWAAGARTLRAGSERGTATNKDRPPRLTGLLLGVALAPLGLLATLLWGVLDSRPGGSDIAMIWCALMLCLAIGPILRFGPRVPWATALQGLVIVAAVAAAGGSVAAARYGWEPDSALFASFRPDPAAADLEVETNDFGDPVVVGPAVEAPSDIVLTAATRAVRTELAPTDGIYVGFASDGLPFDLDDVDRWSQQVTEPQIVHWYQQWGSGESRFRGDWLAEIAARDRIPMISWEAWAKPDGTFHSADQELGELARIVAGERDAYIDEWAIAAADYGHPLLLRPFHEMNGFWYPWSVGENGNTADDFVAAWRHVVSRFDAAGADNVSFVWSINTLASFEEGKGVEAYYPGDDYVDWVATSGFNWADYADWSSWVSAEWVFGETYEVLAGFDKPIMFAEVGTGHNGGDDAAWVADALNWFAGLPELDAIVWFDRRYDGDIDFRLDPRQQQTVARTVAAEASLAPEIELFEHPVEAVVLPDHPDGPG